MNASLIAARRKIREVEGPAAADESFERLDAELNRFVSHYWDRPHWTPRSSPTLEIRAADDIAKGAYEYRTRYAGWSLIFTIEPSLTDGPFDFGTVVWDGFIWDHPKHGPMRITPEPSNQHQ